MKTQSSERNNDDAAQEANVKMDTRLRKTWGKRAFDNLLAFRPKLSPEKEHFLDKHTRADDEELLALARADYEELIELAGTFGVMIGRRGHDIITQRACAAINTFTAGTAYFSAFVAAGDVKARLNADRGSPTEMPSHWPLGMALGTFCWWKDPMPVYLFIFITFIDLAIDSTNRLLIGVSSSEDQDVLRRFNEEALQVKIRSQYEHWIGSLFISFASACHLPKYSNIDLYNTLLYFPCDVSTMTKKVQDAAFDVWVTVEPAVQNQSAPINSSLVTLQLSGQDQKLDTAIASTQKGAGNTWHNEDFTSVCWYGNAYSFSPTEAACVRVLWERWEQGVPEIHHGEILAKSGSQSSRLIDVFRRNKKYHPAWKTMILGLSKPKGFYRLNPPTAS